MNKKQKRLRCLCALGLLLCVYPAFVLVYTWSLVFTSDLRGGRNGPLDAYRHALASSIVSYTLGEPAVDMVTHWFESRGQDSNNMDSHNNKIGAAIGSSAQSFRELEPLVRESVLKGTVDATNRDQITWLPEKKWRNGRIW